MSPFYCNGNVKAFYFTVETSILDVWTFFDLCYSQKAARYTSRKWDSQMILHSGRSTAYWALSLCSVVKGGTCTWSRVSSRKYVPRSQNRTKPSHESMMLHRKMFHSAIDICHHLGLEHFPDQVWACLSGQGKRGSWWWGWRAHLATLDASLAFKYPHLRPYTAEFWRAFTFLVKH